MAVVPGLSQNTARTEEPQAGCLGAFKFARACVPVGVQVCEHVPACTGHAHGQTLRPWRSPAADIRSGVILARKLSPLAWRDTRHLQVGHIDWFETTARPSKFNPCTAAIDSIVCQVIRFDSRSTSSRFRPDLVRPCCAQSVLSCATGKRRSAVLFALLASLSSDACTRAPIKTTKASHALSETEWPVGCRDNVEVTDTGAHQTTNVDLLHRLVDFIQNFVRKREERRAKLLVRHGYLRRCHPLFHEQEAHHRFQKLQFKNTYARTAGAVAAAGGRVHLSLPPFLPVIYVSLYVCPRLAFPNKVTRPDHGAGDHPVAHRTAGHKFSGTP